MYHAVTEHHVEFFPSEWFAFPKPFRLSGFSPHDCFLRVGEDGIHVVDVVVTKDFESFA